MDEGRLGIAIFECALQLVFDMVAGRHAVRVRVRPRLFELAGLKERRVQTHEVQHVLRRRARALLGLLLSRQAELDEAHQSLVAVVLGVARLAVLVPNDGERELKQKGPAEKHVDKEERADELAVTELVPQRVHKIGPALGRVCDEGNEHADQHVVEIVAPVIVGRAHHARSLDLRVHDA